MLGNTRSDDANLDAFLAKSMAQLSFAERQKEQEDVHGVSNMVQEDPLQMKSWLEELDNYINGMKGGTAYEVAESIDASYVQDRDFRKMFLRGKRYEVREAAHQMIRFFDMKLRLFGEGKLAKDIMMSDLDDDDRTYLIEGSLQILPAKDRAKRDIVISLLGIRSFKPLRSELRARFYLLMTMLRESPYAQLRGVIFILYAVGQYKDTSNGAGFVDNARLSLAIPYHIAGGHVCTDDPTQYSIMYAAMSLIPAKLGARMKLHLGSHLECQYHLSTFGVPTDALPFSVETGNYEPDYHLFWYQNQVLRELGSLPPNMVHIGTKPLKHDVVFAGNKKRNDWGSKRIRSLVKLYAERYDDSDSNRKGQIIDEIIEEITSYSGRFLKLEEDSGGWTELPLKDIRERIGQKFRNMRRPLFSQDDPRALRDGSPFVEIEEPSAYDVLLGRKRNHPGNVRLREMVKDLGDKYDAADKGDKTVFVDLVFRAIRKDGGRFLKQSSGSSNWVEVSDEVAAAKIFKNFRNNRRGTK